MQLRADTHALRHGGQQIMQVADHLDRTVHRSEATMDHVASVTGDRDLGHALHELLAELRGRHRQVVNGLRHFGHELHIAAAVYDEADRRLAANAEEAAW
jgi:hypothetical protein